MIAGSALTIPSILAACGIGPASFGGRAGRLLPHRTPAGALEWANWPLYIDIDDDGNYPSIVAFTEETGIEVNYTEAIQDNADFIGRHPARPPGRQPDRLGHHHARRLGGRTMARLGLLEELDHSQLPNWTANAADYAKGLWFDPEQPSTACGGRAASPASPTTRADRPRDHDVRRPARPGLRRRSPARSATCATCSA